MKRPRKSKQPHTLRRLFGLLLLFTLLISASVFGMRWVNRDQYACVAFHGQIADVNTQRVMTDTRIAYTTLTFHNDSVSPDRKYIVRINAGKSAEILKSDGTKIHHLDIPNNAEGNLWLYFRGWSADSQYFAIELGSNPPATYIWRVTDLKMVTLDSTANDPLRWLPQGHEYAYINGRLFVSSPDGTVTKRFATPKDYQVYRWSPTGQYIALISTEDVTSVNDFRYRFAIVNLNNGHTYLAIGDYGIVGEDGNSPPQVAEWSADGRSWIYLQQHGDATHIDSTVMSLDAETGVHSTLTHDNIEQTVALSPSGEYVAVRATRNDKKALNIINVNTGRQTTLYTNADVFIGEPSWSPDSRYVAAAYGIGREVPYQRTWIVWANADGTNRHEVETGIISVRQYQWLNDTWLAYNVSRPDYAYDDGFGVQVADLKTGKTYILVSGLTDGALGNFWDGGGVYLSPDGHTFTVQRGPTVNQSARTLSLVQLNGQRTVDYHAARMSIPAWSPDGTRLAFIMQNNFDPTGEEFWLKIVTAQGEEVWSYSRAGFDGSNNEVRWTQCN